MLKKGFSLIELLVVVAIIGILAAIGTIGYQNYIDGTRVATADEERNQKARKIENDIIASQTGVVDGSFDTCLDMVDSQIAEYNVNSSNPYNNPGDVYLNAHREARNGSNTINLLAGQQIIMCSNACAAPESVEIILCSCTDPDGCTTGLGTPPGTPCPTPAAVSGC